MSESLNEKELRATIKRLGDYIDSYEELVKMNETGYLDSCEIGDDFLSEAPDLIKTLKKAHTLLLES